MNIKMKLVSAACLALCSVGAFAVTANSCKITTASANDATAQAQLVNKCAPEVTFYVGGASAQAPALTTVLTTTGVIFDTTKPFVKVRDTALTISGSGGSTALAAGKDGNTVAYLGYGDASVANIAGKRVMVIYNKANGSFAGVNQMLTGKGGNLEEVTLVTTTFAEAKAGTGKATPCTVSTAAADTIPTYECSTEANFSAAWGGDKQKSMHLALADVRPSEATPGVVKAWDAKAYPAKVTGMQGFGIIVNANLYGSLITRETAAGRLPSSCTSAEATSGTITAACQPSLAAAEYTSLISGKAKTANTLLGVTGDSNLLALHRRGNASGTQAASNIFFAGQAAYNSKMHSTDGSIDVLAGSTTAVGDLTVTEQTGTGNVINAVRTNTTGYALGVVSLENTFTNALGVGKKGAGTFFVKLDGISPNFVADGTLDSKARFGMQAGYPFAYEMQAITSSKLATPYLDISTAIVTALKNPVGNLAGIAYIGTSTAVDTAFTHNGNNYLPLSK